MCSFRFPAVRLNHCADGQNGLVAPFKLRDVITQPLQLVWAKGLRGGQQRFWPAVNRCFVEFVKVAHLPFSFVRSQTPQAMPMRQAAKYQKGKRAISQIPVGIGHILAVFHVLVIIAAGVPSILHRGIKVSEGGDLTGG